MAEKQEPINQEKGNLWQRNKIQQEMMTAEVLN